MRVLDDAIAGLTFMGQIERRYTSNVRISRPLGLLAGAILRS